MCGRYTLTADMKKVADRFGAPMLLDERLLVLLLRCLAFGWKQ